MISRVRTDLAMEAEQIFRQSGHGEGEIPGISSCISEEKGFRVHSLQVLDSRGEKAIGKAKGRYVTIELGALLRREEKAFGRACTALARQLRSLIPLPVSSSILVIGLGNRDITPDAIGPIAVENIMVTRHLRSALPEHFGSFRSVCSLCSGVLGTTGIESGDFIAAMCQKLRPAAVIAVDALASRSASRLCRTVQLSDTGITPGAGVGNPRQTLSKESLGVPVIAVGVPTVVDAATLCADMLMEAGVELDEAALPHSEGLFVTPRDIDRCVRDTAKLIGYGINLALHDGISVEDVDMFLG